MVPGIGVECVCLSGAMLAKAGTVLDVYSTAFTIYPFPTTHVSNTRVEGGGGDLEPAKQETVPRHSDAWREEEKVPHCFRMLIDLFYFFGAWHTMPPTLARFTSSGLQG